MFHLTRVWRIAAVTAATAATLLTVTALNGAHAAPRSASAHSPRTTLHIHVAGCDRCTVQLQQALPNEDHPLWQTRRRNVGSDHVVTFTVKTGFTHGMSFVVRAPWAKGTDSVPNAVTAYAGHKLGSAISDKAARHAGRAAGCWSGTGLATKDLSFKVSRVRTTGANGQKVVTPLVYAPHTMSAWKPFVRTFHGAIGNQDAFYCTPPTS